MNKEIKSHLSNLISVALADGKLVESERKLLIQIGKRLGLNEEEVMEYINHHQEIEFVIPTKSTDCYTQLYELISMVIVDEEMHEKEEALLKKYARKLNFSEDVVDKITEKIREFLHKGYNANKINLNLDQFLKII